MASDLCKLRLRKEYKQLITNPVDNIRACPKETNILEWHYVIEGAKNSDFEGGYYHGIINFPREYPYKPPSIQMLTPNGRFKVATRLCLSMSDFHPETWNPMWSVGTILMGLYSFMLEEAPTHGSMNSTAAFKRKAAVESLAVNTQNKIFCELFPELVELYEQQQKENELNGTLNSGRDAASLAVTSASGGAAGTAIQYVTSWSAMAGILFAVLACTWAVIALSLQ